MGQEALDRLRACRVAVFGVGGVGGSVVETLARSGVGTIDVIDDDKVCLTNLNRQILATRATIGMYKVDAAEERVHQIDPDIKVIKHKMFYLPGETADQIDFHDFDYVVDSLDTMSAKIDIVMQAKEAGVPVISCMGAGNRVDPSKLQVTDIYKTSMDPLSKIMRKEMKKRRVRKLKVVFSTEPPIRPLSDSDNSCRNHCICPPGTKRKCTQRRDIPGSTSFVPPSAGIMAASEVVLDLTEFDPSDRIKGGRQN